MRDEAPARPRVSTGAGEGLLIESAPVQVRRHLERLSTRLLATCVFALVLLPTAALAQAPPDITPNTSITPTKTVQPWIYQMAIGAVILGVIILLAVLASYLRFSPKFFGREQAPATVPPGTRPQRLTREAAARRPAPVATAAATASAPAASAATSGPATATAVAERPAPPAEGGPAEAPAARAEPAAAASAEATAGPSGEAAVQADAVGQTEAAEPDPRPTAKAPEETGPVAEAPAASGGSPAAPAASHTGSAALDQETFDRVLAEQIEKGVDRRVAEGRARAAAVVAARKKAQG